MEEWNGLRRDTYKEGVHMNDKIHETDKNIKEGDNRTRKSHNTKNQKNIH